MDLRKPNGIFRPLSRFSFLQCTGCCGNKVEILYPRKVCRARAARRSFPGSDLVWAYLSYTCCGCPTLSKCHPFYVQYFPVMITIRTNTHMIYARYQPPDHQPLQHREVDSWGILSIHENSTEGLDSWSSSFSSQSMLSLLKYVIVTHIRTVPPNIHSCRGREARLVKHLPHGFLRIACN